MSASTSTTLPVTLTHRFADDLPELALDWQAAEAPEPQLLVLNPPLAVELGLDPDWLRSPDGVRFLVGGLVPDDARPVATTASDRVVGMPSACMASLTTYSRSIGPTTARPSPPRANGVRPEPLRCRSRRPPPASVSSPSSRARPSPSRGE